MAISMLKSKHSVTNATSESNCFLLMVALQCQNQPTTVCIRQIASVNIAFASVVSAMHISIRRFVGSACVPVSFRIKLVHCAPCMAIALFVFASASVVISHANTSLLLSLSLSLSLCLLLSLSLSLALSLTHKSFLQIL